MEPEVSLCPTGGRLLHTRVFGKVPVVRKKLKQFGLGSFGPFRLFCVDLGGREVSHWIHGGLEIQIDEFSAHEAF